MKVGYISSYVSLVQR